MTDPAIELPLRIHRVAESFAIQDAADRSVASVYFCDAALLRGIIKRFTKDEARAIVQHPADHPPSGPDA